MSKPYWRIIADEIADLGLNCDYNEVDTTDEGVLVCAYADNDGEHRFIASAETKLNAFMELKDLVVKHLKEVSEQD